MSKGWGKTSIGEVCQVIAGQSPKSNFYNKNGVGVPFHQGKKEFNDKFIGPATNWTEKITRIAEAGDILMSVRAPVGPVNYAIERMCIGRGLAAIRPSSEIESEFLFNFLVYFEQEIIGNAGAVFNSINKAQISAIEIPFPPKAEQKRIVAILDEAFSAIAKAKENAEKNLANARELFESYLNRVFTQQGPGWEAATVGELVDRGIIAKPLDGNHGEIHPKKADFVSSGVPFIMASHLVDGLVNQETCHFVTKKQAKSLRKGFAKDGDVLMSHKGTIGRVAVLNTSLEYVVLTPQVTYYRILDETTLFNRYLYFYFQIPSFQWEIAHIAGAGSTRAYIGITKQLELPIAYPKRGEQERIAATLFSLAESQARLETIYTQKLANLDELKQSLLQKAFTGQLTESTALEEVTA